MVYAFQDLSSLFKPRSIAIVGASDRPNSIGAHTLANIAEYSDFEGDLYLVNPKKSVIGGRPCYPSVEALPVTPDVLVVVVPASAVVAAVAEGGEKGAGFAVILTSGFSEADDWGKAEEAKLVEISQETGIRIYGPNCPGLVNVNKRLGMSFSPAFRHDLRPGPIGLATQGGGLGRNLMQAMDRGAGIAMWSSSGNECDLQVADFVHYMADDPDVKVICTLIEGIKDGPRFVAALAHAASRGKPVVGVKVGRSEYGVKAAISHTASMTGSAEVNSAVFKQFGMIEVDDLDEIVDVATLLARAAPRGGEEVAVFASSGGAASLCADNVGAAGLKLASFTRETTGALQNVLPDYAAIGNPVDTTSVTISNPDSFLNSLLPVARDPNVGLVLLPIAMDYAAITGNTARLIVEAQQQTQTPLCPIWMSDRLGEGYDRLQKAGIAPFRSLRNMGKAVRRWVDYGSWRHSADMDWRPLLVARGVPAETGAVETLNEIKSKAELAAAGIPVAQARLALSPAEAVGVARSHGGTVAMKIVSKQIAHKSDVGGVALDVPADKAGETFDALMTNVAVARPDAELDGVLVEPMAKTGGVEAFVGVSRDPVFGHVLTFGLGGVHVELFRDVTRRILPVTPAIALEMIGELKSSPLLRGMRGAGARDVAALASFMAAVSDYVAANYDTVEELDLNPVWVGREGEGVTALDAVIVKRR
ncbi:MAG: acetate--CoA ligase family protein [Salinarimonas sp.]